MYKLYTNISYIENAPSFERGERGEENVFHEKFENVK